MDLFFLNALNCQMLNFKHIRAAKQRPTSQWEQEYSCLKVLLMSLPISRFPSSLTQQ